MPDRYALPHAAATNVVAHYQFTHSSTHPLSPFATVTLIAYINDSSLSTSQSKYLACAPLATEVLLLIQTPVTFVMTHYSLCPPICVAYSLPSLRTVHSRIVMPPGWDRGRLNSFGRDSHVTGRCHHSKPFGRGLDRFIWS